MSPQLAIELGLTQEEKRNFPHEATALWNGLRIPGQPDSRALREILVIYRRRFSDLSEMERLFRQDTRLFVEDWLEEVVALTAGELPAEAANRRILLSAAAMGLDTTMLAELAAAYLKLPEFREPDELYRRATLPNLREYVVFLRDFGPYVSAQSTDFARRLLLTYKGVASADIVARFVTLHRLQFSELFTGQPWVDDPKARQWTAWYTLFQDHTSQEADLPKDFLVTPFNEVIRNVPAQAWYDVYRNDRVFGGWPFAFREKGFFYLAAGKSSRAFLREIGLSRSAWRAYLRLPETMRLSDVNRPQLFVWALGLGASQQLAAQLPSFMSLATREDWEPLVQQLARLTDVGWGTETGQRLLGYVYHLLRDQPNFRVDTRRPEALLEAANDHYERIEGTQREIQRQRLRATQADLEARTDAQRQQEIDERRRRREYEKRQQQSKWSPLKSTKPLSSPNGKLRIYELTNGWELHLEGVAMSHCVGGYTGHCLSGRYSIWSLRFKEARKERSIVTIRVDVRSRRIVEARARYNRVPEKEYRELINAWAKMNRLGELEDWERMYYV